MHNIIKRKIKSLKKKRKYGAMYMSTVVKVIACVVIGALLISGLALTLNMSMNTANGKVSSLFARSYDYEGSGGSGSGGGGGAYVPGEQTSAEYLEGLKQAHAFEYYSSLSLAVDDLNNSTRDSADIDENNAVAGIYTTDDGTDSVVLLKNTTESVAITINKDCVIDLAGNTLNLDTNASCLNIASGISATLNGSISGSSIKKNVNGTVSYLVTSSGNLAVKGGNYSISGSYINGSSSATCMAFSQKKTSNNISFKDCIISAKNNASGSKCYAYGIQAYGTNMDINNCNITVELEGSNFAFGLYNHANTEIDNSILSTYSNSGTSECIITENKINIYSSKIYADSNVNNSYGIVSHDSSIVNVKNSEINVSSEYKSYGIHTAGETTINNTKIFADAAGNDAETNSYSIGISSSGTLTFNSGSVYGSHSGIGTQEGSKTYVNGGTFASCSHGGFYFAHGSTGEAYIENANIKCINPSEVNSKFDTSKYTNEALGGFYVGGGTQSRHSNISVYMNNCKISGGNNSFVIRGTSGETNNKVYISNSTISSGTKIRLDTGGHALYMGKGNNFTESDVYKNNLGGATSSVVTTDDVYKK